MKRRDSKLKEQDSPSGRLPARVEPMMLTHLALTGDTKQYDQWKNRVERLRQAQAVDRAQDPDSKSLLASTPAWRQIRETGLLGAMVGLGIGSIWTSELMWLFAVDHGFGWLASSIFLIPLPIAWYVGRRLWERASLQGMKDHAGPLTARKRLRGFTRAVGRSFTAGFGFGFTLVFLQALLSGFLDVAPTMSLELLTDLRDGVLIGTMMGLMGVMLGPLVGRPPPEETPALPPPALPMTTED